MFLLLRLVCNSLLTFLSTTFLFLLNKSLISQMNRWAQVTGESLTQLQRSSGVPVTPGNRRQAGSQVDLWQQAWCSPGAPCWAPCCFLLRGACCGLRGNRAASSAVSCLDSPVQQLRSSLQPWGSCTWAREDATSLLHGGTAPCTAPPAD